MATLYCTALFLFICGSTYAKPFNGNLEFSANIDFNRLLQHYYGFPNSYVPMVPVPVPVPVPSPTPSGTTVPSVGTTVGMPPPVTMMPTMPPPVPSTTTPAPVTDAPTGGCKGAGYFLPNPADICTYIECVILSEPWQDGQGNIPLDMVVRPCAPGTGVPSTFDGGIFNPCTSVTNQCAAPPQPMTPAPATPAPMTMAPATPPPATPAPMTMAPTMAPMTPMPMTPSPMTPAPTPMVYPPNAHVPQFIPIIAGGYNPYSIFGGGFGGVPGGYLGGYGRK